MKILILGCKDYPAFRSPWVHSGGMEVYVERMVRSLSDRARFTLISAGGASDDHAAVVALGAAQGLRTQPFSLFWRTLRYLLAKRPPFDVVNAQTPLAGFAALLAHWRWKIPYVVTVHIFGSDPSHAGGRLAALAYGWIEKMALSRAVSVVPTGRALAAALAERYPGAKPRIRVVTSAGDGVRATAPKEGTRARLGLPSDAPVLLFLGRMVRENGIHDLLAAMAQLRAVRPEARLILAGSGDPAEVAAVEAKISTLDLADRARWIGSLHGQEKLDVIAAADLLVRTSLHEVFPEAYVEALSVGTPVVATPAGDTAALAQESGAIRLVPFRDPPAQAAAIRELLDAPEERERMRERAIAYSARVTWATQKELYWRVLELASRGLSSAPGGETGSP